MTSGPAPEHDPRDGLREDRQQRVARLRLLRRFTDFVPDLLAANRRPAAATPASAPVGSPTESLADIRDDLGDCTRCPLAAGRQTIVFGVGRPNAELMFIGEGPGRDEDRQGEPFVGAAGRLLNEMIEKCFRRRRDEVYIANIVKCRPPGNRNPAPDEVAACLPFLKRQIASVRPRVICLLGGVAVKALFADVRGITAARGTVRELAGIPVVPTFHPAYLLRAEGDRLDDLKRQVLDDARLALGFLGE